MPDYAFRSYNPSGSVQIDSDFQNLALRSKGSVSINAFSGLAYYANLTIPCSPDGQIAFNCPTQYIGWVSSTYSNGMKTFRLRSWRNAVVADYWLFDNPQFGDKGSNQYGRRLYNAQGQLVYDSRMKYMKVIGNMMGTTNQVSDFKVSQAFPGRSRLAVIQAGNAMQPDYFLGDGTDPFYWLESYNEQQCMIANNNTVLLDVVYSGTKTHEYGSLPPPDMFFYWKYNYLILDVSGY